jgi:hypothetical protein
MTKRRKTGRWRPDSVGKKAGTNSMTIVIAARRDEEALLLADTMIGNRGERRNDVVPGRLKIVTIGPRVTVAFAGNADSADVALRQARAQLLETGVGAAIDVLKEDSRSSATDYIVASHLERLNLIRIRNGATLEIGVPVANSI